MLDYRNLNFVTKITANPQPCIVDIFGTLSELKCFATLGLAMEYHKVEVLIEDKKNKEFNTLFGLFEYKVMPFGLATAPAAFMRLMTIAACSTLRVMLTLTILSYSNSQLKTI